MQDQPLAFPESEPFEVPVNWNTSKRHQDRVVVAGRGPKPADIMFLASGTLEEEVVEEEHGMHGAIFRRKPAFLKGPHGVELKDMCMSVGIAVDSEVYYTALCKWLLGRDRNLNPKAGDIQPGLACCRREIKEVAPKIIVAFGKAAFEFLVPIRFKFGDAIGMWFWSEEFQCRVMPMSSQYYVAAKPEWMERYRMDMAQVKKLSDELKGIAVERVPLHYRTVTCATELRQLVQDIMPFTLYCPDCEWHGKNHAAGKLRSLQIGWQPGHAAYIRFMDDKLNYVFDVSYEEAGAILAPAWNRPEVKLVGHHISADLPWTSEWLKLEWYGKVRLDTEFAYQCCNEHGERGLERMSLRYTDLGRYEFELEMWKKDHKQEVEDGYGRVPDEILIPYGLKDVDVPLRALPYIELDLQQQGMLEYYQTIMNPFVSDVFTQFAITGLPMNVPLMDEMRLLYSYAYSEMEAALRRSLYTEAWFLLARNAVEILPAFKAVDEPLRGIVSKQAVANFKLELQDVYERHGAEEMQIPSTKVIRDLCMAFLQLEEGSLTPEDLRCLDASCNHACSTHAFNLRSVTDMRRWLFDIKKYTPVKSTANKAKGVPSMDWAKVMSWKPSRREGIVPAVDKQTLQILSVAHDDPVLKELLELNAVGNIRKAFLKDPELDEDGNVVEEAGLHAWLAPDHRVHGQMSMTETARPRAWKPNSLNWPSYVQERIVDGIARVLKIAHERGDLPQVFEKYLKDKPPALRHCVQAPPGMCFVESDFKTAEVRALAYRAGDENLIRIMNEPDQQFGLAPVKTKDGAIKYKPVRLKYDADCGILTQEQDSRFIMNVWSEGKFECKVAPEDLKRDRAGNLVHPPADLHWSLAEMFQEKPRELMTDKKDRGAGKAGNFKTAYGSTPGTLERSIEADTGFKPEPGTGQKILDALQRRQPTAVAFLDDLETKVEDPGYLRAASGKVRHFLLPSNVHGLSPRLKNAIISAQKRESRNFYMQESVAATALRATYWLLQFKRKYGLVGVPITVLYDSVVTMCPFEERAIWAKAHELFMFRANGWEYHGRVLTYPIDTEFNAGWSMPYKATIDQKHIGPLLENENFCPTPERLRPVETWLDDSIAFYTANTRASLEPKHFV